MKKISSIIHDLSKILMENGDVKMAMEPTEIQQPFAASEWICFTDLERVVNPEQFIADALNSLRAKLPKDQKFVIRWANRANADVASSEYNPLSNRGRFMAYEELPPEKAALRDFIDNYKAVRSMA